jgi:hypothetical protein
MHGRFFESAGLSFSFPALVYLPFLRAGFAGVFSFLFFLACNIIHIARLLPLIF